MSDQYDSADKTSFCGISPGSNDLCITPYHTFKNPRRSIPTGLYCGWNSDRDASFAQQVYFHQSALESGDEGRVLAIPHIWTTLFPFRDGIEDPRALRLSPIRERVYLANRATFHLKTKCILFPSKATVSVMNLDGSAVRVITLKKYLWLRTMGDEWGKGQWRFPCDYSINGESYFCFSLKHVRQRVREHNAGTIARYCCVYHADDSDVA
jgi:hypothetical protein